MAQRQPSRGPARVVLVGVPSALSMAMVACASRSSIIDHPPLGFDESEQMRLLLHAIKANTIRREPAQRAEPFDVSMSYLFGRHRPRRQRHITLDSYVWHRLEPAAPKERDKERQAKVSRARKKRRAKGRR